MVAGGEGAQSDARAVVDAPDHLGEFHRAAGDGIAAGTARHVDAAERHADAGDQCADPHDAVAVAVAGAQRLPAVVTSGSSSATDAARAHRQGCTKSCLLPGKTMSGTEELPDLLALSARDPRHRRSQNS